MIEGRNIICIASSWDIDPTSKHQVMKLLARKNRIIWVNYHGSRRPSASLADGRAVLQKLRQILAGPKQVDEAITVITPLVLPMPASKTARWLNRQLLIRQIRSVLKNCPPRPVQLWSFAPDVSFLAGAFDEERLVYYCVDEFSEFEGYDKQVIASLERDLIRKASVVITTSRRLYDSKRKHHSQTHLITHGVDDAHFAKAVDPATPLGDDVQALRRPIIGFYGLIQHWVDLDLVARVAGARPDWSFVMIGQVLQDASRIPVLPNLHFLGRKAYADLPAYSKAFDVGMIPFRRNELTLNVNPIKLREYLSAGLPVVSTSLPEVQAYDDFVEFGEDAESFEAAIERALNARDDVSVRRRREAMQRETWTAKVEHVSSIVMAARQDAVPIEALPAGILTQS